MDNERLLNSALWYREKKGFSVFPVGHNKKPMIAEWEPYQKEKPSPDLIREWWTGEYKGANIGIVTGAISNLTVVDVDSKNGSQTGFEALEEITPEGLLTPTASSPSGGEHRYFNFHEGSRNRVMFLPDCDLRSEGGYIIAPPSQNGRGSYAWKDGLSITEVPLSNIPILYIKALDKGGYGGGEDFADNSTGYKRLHLATNGYKIKDGTRDEALFHIANHLIQGRMPTEEVQQILRIMALHGCEVPFPEREIDSKITSVLNRQSRQTQNIADDVLEWVSATSGYFTTTNVHNELQTATRKDKRTVNQALARLCNDGIIERVGTKTGTYQLIEKDCQEIDWRNAEMKDLSIQYPFGLERFFITMPKNIIILSGSPDAGKTALLLNMVKLNMKRHKVWYFSSEMGPLELRNRLGKFEIPMDEWNFEAKERASNFAKVIKPNDINIIDFLEVSDNFFQVGKFITDIHNELKNGIAVIALQKKRGQSLGRGAEFSEEKARLYMTVDSDFPGAILRIRKCKNWRNPMVRPTGHAMKFKILSGCQLQPQGVWYREEE